MATYVDPGDRCEKHVGEVFPPRCANCGTIDSENTALWRDRYTPFSECISHRGWPMPCGRCTSLGEAHENGQVRCDRHADLIDPPRCAACTTLEHEYWQLGLVDRPRTSRLARGVIR